MMDFIRVFEIELDRAVYYAGEMLTGHVYVEVEENMRVQNIRVFMRGKAHAEWKITRAGERRNMKQDEHYIDERLLIWGKEDNDHHQGIPIMTRGRHRYPFHFQLPDTALPCSFESKIGNIRYYIRVNINIPYASCPQTIRYFTIVGPNIDCMDERFLVPVQATAKRNSCSLCCGKGPMLLRATLERTSFVCGEPIRLKAEVQNGSDSEVWVLCKLVQYVEFFINKGVLGLSKEVRHVVLEVESDRVPPHETTRLDELVERLIVPVMPPTMIEVCGLVQIYYTLKLYLETSKGKGDAAEVSMPITIGTVPVRAPNSPPPEVHYEISHPNVEGGMYISPEFQLGQVYMGEEVDPETDHTILYRPVYVCVRGERPVSRADSNLLQVPSRQSARSRENIRGSQEAIQENMTQSSQQQNMVKLFQVQNEAGSHGSREHKPAVEDKFLKEITAKLANRQHQSEEVKTGQGTASPTHQSEIESHVEMMRKQKTSSDVVHKALVSELRRHLSEESGDAEVHHVHLKKVGGLKKVAETTHEPGEDSKRFKSEVKTEQTVQHFTTVTKHKQVLPHPAGDSVPQKCKTKKKESVEVTSSMESSGQFIESMSDAQEQEVEIEYSEHASLLAGEIAQHSDAMRQSGASTSTEQDQKYHQQSHAELPVADYEVAAAVTTPLVSEGEDIQEVGEEDLEALAQIAEKGNNLIAKQKHADSQKYEEELSVDISCEIEQSSSAFERKLQSPKVAPKPKQNVRHSFPAHVPDSGGLLSGSELVVEVAGRPKSQLVESSKQRSDVDSTV